MDNLELAKLVDKQVTAEPESLEMSRWISQCGAVACLAGHAMLQSGYTVEGRFFFRPDGMPVDSESLEARELLGLTPAEYQPRGQFSLFYGAQSREQAIGRFRALIRAEEERRAAQQE